MFFQGLEISPKNAFLRALNVFLNVGHIQQIVLVGGKNLGGWGGTLEMSFPNKMSKGTVWTSFEMKRPFELTLRLADVWKMSTFRMFFVPFNSS